MKKITSGIFTFILVTALSSSYVYANLTPLGKITQIILTDASVHPVDGIEIRLSGPAGVACANSDHWSVLLFKDDPRYDEKYSILLAAYMGGNQVRIHAWQCVSYGANTHGRVQSIVLTEEQF